MRADTDPILNKNYEKYKEFYDFLILNNQKFNLTSILDYDDFLIKHVLDSSVFNEIYSKDSSIIEIGSGAGFPSVPIKIERSDLKFTLVEANEKKCGFLREVKNKFDFSDFQVICARAEELSKKEGFNGAFDYAVARAVAPLNILCELILPFLKVGGTAVAYKGANFEEEIDLAEKAIALLGGKIGEVKKYSLPGGAGERALVLINKIAKTPEGYPRRFSKIKKCPL